MTSVSVTTGKSEGGSARAASRAWCRQAAAVKEEHSQPGLAWIVLTDPEGNEFCIGEHTD